MPSRQSSHNASVPYLVKTFQAMAIAVVSYFLYWTYQLHQCGEIPISKKDVMLRRTTLARFPVDYGVEIESADLLGFSEKLLVAYGNRRFVGEAFAMDGQVIEHLGWNQERTNLPLVGVFYIAESGPLSSLLNLSPFLDIQKSMVELSLREYREIQLVPFDPDARRKPREQFEADYAFLQLFSLSQLEIADYDGGNRDELRLDYLSYVGGSGGARWSVIYDLRDDALTAHSGYPEMLDVDVIRFIQAVNLYTGLDGTLPRDQRQLEDVVGRGSKRFTLTAAERQALVADPSQRDDYARVLMSLSPRSPYAPDRFIDLGDGSRLNLTPRHADDCLTFLDIGGGEIFVEAFYVDDGACHWCEHRWRVMTFHYDGGRQISDRIINDDGFSGQWLRNAEPLGLSDVFDIYRDQGPAGLAWSFIDPRWTASSQHGLDNPLNVGMHALSLVKQWVKEHYRES